MNRGTCAYTHTHTVQWLLGVGMTVQVSKGHPHTVREGLRTLIGITKTQSAAAAAEFLLALGRL